MSAPGSVSFLMRHELRLLYRGASHRVLGGSSLLILGVLLHLCAIPIAMGGRVLSSPLPQLPMFLVSMFVLLSGLTLTARGLTLAVQALYERGDLDLLLSSPLRAETLFAVRASAIAISLAAEVAVFLIPFVDVFVLFGHVRWAAAYVALPLSALLVTSLSLWLALGLLKWMGARRTRVFAQVLAALIGTGAAVVTQLPAYLSRRDSRLALGWLALGTRLPDADSPLWWPARAFMGSPLWSPIGALVCVGVFAITIMQLSQPFTEGLALTTDIATRRPRASAGARSARFGGGVLSVLARKELRLLRRDPWLLTQLLQQNLYLIPAAIMLLRIELGGVSCAWLGLVIIAGGVASALAWVAASGEEAPDLIGSAPVTALQLIAAQLIASMLPVLICLSIGSAVLALFHPLAALLLFVCALGNALCNAALHIRYKRPNKRSEWKRRRMNNNIPLLFAELGLMSIWSGAGMLGLFLQS